jgi:tetratricopeptide (TPR) repeat protein
MIKCRVLGSPDLTDGTGQRLHAILDNPKRLALLAYLAIEARGVAVPRDKLAAIFWPNFDTAQARSALRRLLLSLRRDLGDQVIRDLGATLLIMNPDKFVCDVSDFENALRESRHERALAIYGTGLLAGVTLADGPEFNAWLARKRAEYAGRASDAAIRLRAEAILAPAVPRLSISTPAVPAAAVPAPAVPAPAIPAPAIPAPAIPAPRISSESFAARPAYAVRRPRRLAIARARALATASALIVVAAAWFTWEQPLKHLTDFGGTLRLSGGATRNAEAVAVYQQGVAFANRRTADGVARAIGHFQKAILLDSNYALAYAGLSKALQQAAAHDLLPPSDALLMSRAVVMHALRLDPTLADAHASLGYIKLHLERDWPAAEAALRRAIELKPGHATAYHYLAELGMTYERSGRPADAARVRKSFRADQGAR